MDPVNVIRAPSLKRGKNDERLSDRVSLLQTLKYDFRNLYAFNTMYDKYNREYGLNFRIWSIVVFLEAVRSAIWVYCVH